MKDRPEHPSERAEKETLDLHAKLGCVVGTCPSHSRRARRGEALRCWSCVETPRDHEQSIGGLPAFCYKSMRILACFDSSPSMICARPLGVMICSSTYLLWAPVWLLHFHHHLTSTNATDWGPLLKQVLPEECRVPRDIESFPILGASVSELLGSDLWWVKQRGSVMENGPEVARDGSQPLTTTASARHSSRKKSQRRTSTVSGHDLAGCPATLQAALNGAVRQPNNMRVPEIDGG